MPPDESPTPQLQPPPPQPPKDLTAILLPEGQLTEPEVRRLVAERGPGDLLVRVAPLPSVKLVQVEVHEAKEGLPCEDPELVGRLAQNGRAVFVHVNHSAKQAMVHAFVDGQPQEGFAGAPGEEFDGKLRAALALDVTLPAITAADDGSRIGIGIASTRTAAWLRGTWVVVPPGTPTDFDSFAFHDRGAGLDEDATERMALFAFDAAAARLLFDSPGRELAAHLSAAPAKLFGPLDGARPEVTAALAALGDRSPSKAGVTDVRVIELCVLACARAYAGGDAQSYWDQRVLPMFSLASDEPRIDPADADELEECDSVLHAMAEVLPFSAPPGGEGALLGQIADAEVGPLAPWAKPGEEYSGAIFTLEPTRLFELVRALDGRKLQASIDKFERAWYRAARPGMPEGDALSAWRKARSEDGQADLERFLRDWTELRIVLEVAALNRLSPAMLFYEGR